MTKAEEAEVINFVSAWLDHKVAATKRKSNNSNGSKPNSADELMRCPRPNRKGSFLYGLQLGMIEACIKSPD